MKALVLVIAVLFAGCATTTDPTPETDARIKKLQYEIYEISEREEQCVHETMARSDDQIARLTVTPNDGPTMQKAEDDRERELSECKATANRETEELAAHERADYERAAEDERERNSLMTILTTSRSH